MTTTKKILAVALVCTIPVGIFAYDKYEKDRFTDRNDKKSSFCNGENHYKYHDIDEFEDISYEFIEKSGANLGFEGIVQLKPKDGFNGVWTVSENEVIVDDSTIILMEDNIKITDEVEILAKRENGKIKAIIIEQD